MQEQRSDTMENLELTDTKQNVDIFKKQSQSKEIWRRFKKSKGAVVGLIMLTAILLIIIFANLITPYEMASKQELVNKLASPSAAHWLGTDQFGRDVFARIIYGGRTSLLIALLATMSSCILGSALGAIAGYFGGIVDSIIMRGLDIFMSIPDILFTMAVVFALGPSFTNLLIAFTLAYFTNYVRLVRSQVLNLQSRIMLRLLGQGDRVVLELLYRISCLMLWGL